MLEGFEGLIGEGHQQETLCQSTDTYLCIPAQYDSQHGRHNQKNTQNCRWNNRENMVTTKVTPKRRERLLPWLLRHNKNRQGTTQKYHYKIKFILHEQKLVDIKNNGKVIKTINVRRKSKYFSARNARQF